jgi:hypothetical protein
MEKYRVVKEEAQVADVYNDGFPFPSYNNSDVITIKRYLVQVRGFLFWHTVKSFKKILPAARLLRHLRNLKEE